MKYVKNLVIYVMKFIFYFDRHYIQEITCLLRYVPQTQSDGNIGYHPKNSTPIPHFADLIFLMETVQCENP
jgi:hypothetical protein